MTFFDKSDGLTMVLRAGIAAVFCNLPAWLSLAGAWQEMWQLHRPSCLGLRKVWPDVPGELPSRPRPWDHPAFGDLQHTKMQSFRNVKSKGTYIFLKCTISKLQKTHVYSRASSYIPYNVIMRGSWRINFKRIFQFSSFFRASMFELHLHF